MASGRREGATRCPNGSLGEGDTDATMGRTDTRDGSGVTMLPPGCGPSCGCATNPYGDDALSAGWTDGIRPRTGGGGGAMGKALADGSGALGSTGADNAANDGVRGRGGGSDGAIGGVQPGRGTAIAVVGVWGADSCNGCGAGALRIGCGSAWGMDATPGGGSVWGRDATDGLVGGRSATGGGGSVCGAAAAGGGGVGCAEAWAGDSGARVATEASVAPSFGIFRSTSLRWRGAGGPELEVGMCASHERLRG
jgi:hypothetical protein